jgi:hypothetical protein
VGLAAPGASGEAGLVFASLTLTPGRPGTGQQNWVTGGTSYPGRCASRDAANSKPADGLTGFTVITTPTPFQHHALELLGVSHPLSTHK